MLDDTTYIRNTFYHDNHHKHSSNSIAVGQQSTYQQKFVRTFFNLLLIGI